MAALADFNVEGRMDFAVTPFIRDMMKAEAAMAKAERKLDSLARKLDRLDRQRTNVNVGADTTSAQRSIGRLEQQLNRIRNKTVRVSTIQTGSAPTAATSSAATATTTVNVRGATRAAAELAAVEEQRRRLDGQNVVVRMFLRGGDAFNNGLTTAANNMKRFPSSLMVSGLTAIATAAIPLGGVLGGVLAGGMGAVVTTGAAVVAGVLPMISAFQSVKSTSEGLAKAQADLANAKSAEDIVAAQQRIDAIMQAMPPGMQTVIDKYKEMSTAWSNFGSSFRENTFATFNTGMDMAIKLMGRFEPIARNAAAGLGAVVNEANRRLDSGQWENFYSYLEQAGGRFIQSWGNIVMDFGTGVGNMVVALDPLSTGFTNFLTNTARSFREWSETLATNEGFQNFIRYVQDNAPRVGEFISQMAEMIGRLVVALEPVGSVVLNVATSIAEMVNNFAEANPALFEAVTQGAAFALMLSGLIGPLGSVLGLLGRTGGGLGLLGRGFSALSTIVGGSVGLLRGTNTTMNNMATSAGNLTTRLGGSADAADRTTRVVSGLGTAVGALGVALPIAAAAWGIQQSYLEANRQALQGVTGVAQQATSQLYAGGVAAQQGAANLSQLNTQAQQLSNNGYGPLAERGQQMAQAIQQGANAARDQYAAMTPLEQMQMRVAAAQNAYQVALQSENSRDISAARQELSAATNALTQFQEQLNTSMQTNTERMAANGQEAANAALQAANLSNAQIYQRQQLEAVSTAQNNLTALQQSGTATTAQLQAAQDQLTQAQNSVTTSAIQTANAARDLAIANSNAKTAAGQAAVGNAAYITSLQNLAQQASGPTRTAINQLIAAAGGVPRDVRITAAAEVQGAINNLNRLAEAARSASSGQTSFRSTLGYTARNATGGINPRNQFSLVGEQGPEIAWLNRGEYVSTAAQSKMILKAQKAARVGQGTAMRGGVSNVPYKMASDAQGRGFSAQQSDGGGGGMVVESGAITVHNYHPTDTGTSVSRELSRVQAFSIFSGGRRNARRSVEG